MKLGYVCIIIAPIEAGLQFRQELHLRHGSETTRQEHILYDLRGSLPDQCKFVVCGAGT